MESSKNLGILELNTAVAQAVWRAFFIAKSSISLSFPVKVGLFGELFEIQQKILIAISYFHILILS